MRAWCGAAVVAQVLPGKLLGEHARARLRSHTADMRQCVVCAQVYTQHTHRTSRTHPYFLAELKRHDTTTTAPTPTT